VFTDPTPAMVQFTVTVPESRKDEQPIKVFSRE
jgi:c-di-GMP-binding flagellar brake protein YcgR